MVSSLGWTDEYRVPLCRAFLEVSGDPVMATGRSNDELWAAVHKKWTDLMAEKGPLRIKRHVSALEKQFKNIRKGVSTFTSHYLAVKNMQTTGKLSEEDIISGPSHGTAHWTSLRPFAKNGSRTSAKARRQSGRPSSRIASGWHAGACCARRISSAAQPTQRKTRAWTRMTRRTRTPTAAVQAAPVRATGATSADEWQ